MHHITEKKIKMGPKNKKDREAENAFDGVEQDRTVTNSEEQQIIDDVVTKTQAAESSEEKDGLADLRSQGPLN